MVATALNAEAEKFLSVLRGNLLTGKGASTLRPVGIVKKTNALPSVFWSGPYIQLTKKLALDTKRSNFEYYGGNMLRKVAAVFIAFSIIVFLSGCTAIRGAPERPRPMTEAQKDPRSLVTNGDLVSYNAVVNADDKRRKRNEIIDERILEIDTQFGRYAQTLWQESIAGNIAVDWSLLALSGATATIGGENLKTALGAASAGVIGARESFDKRAFFESALPSLLAQMVAERTKIKARIQENKQFSAADYTIYRALSDLEELIRAGTIPGILSVINHDAGTKQEQAIETIRIVRDNTFTVNLRPRIDRLQVLIRALSDDQAIFLASNLPIVSEAGIATVQAVLGEDFVADGATARQALEIFVSYMNWTEMNVSAFENALAQ